MNDSKNSEFLILMSGLVILALATIGSMVLIFSFVEDTTRSLALATSISSVTVPLMAGLAILMKTNQNLDQIEQTKREVKQNSEEVKQTKEEVKQVGLNVDGRLTQLLEQTALSNEAAGRAAGLVVGHADGMRDERDLQAAREEIPPTPKVQV